jgi:hypothetical protein
LFSENSLELFEELAGGAGDVDAARDAALTILDALYDAGGFGALGTVGALAGIHCFFAVAGLGYLRHGVSPDTKFVVLARGRISMHEILVCILSSDNFPGVKLKRRTAARNL